MKKRKWLGALLNFLLPGLGTAYARKIKKAIFVYFLFYAAVLSVRFIAYNFVLLVVALLLVLVVLLYSIISGYRDVNKNVTYAPARYDVWYVYVVVFVLTIFITNLYVGVGLQLSTINFTAIPTTAMEPTLQVNDKLAFKKTTAIERNDVTVFWYPDHPQTMYIKRCMGLPGDSLQIKNRVVLVNGAPLVSPPLKFRYIATTNGEKFTDADLQKNGINSTELLQLSETDFQLYLTDEQKKAVQKIPIVTNVAPLVGKEGIREDLLYPNTDNFNWNTDFFGPVYIPKKGDNIPLTDKNIDLYLKCIQFENTAVRRDSSGLQVDGQPVDVYQFKENYYFMMGDNRHNSSDSRYWGFVPEELMIGKALYLYASENSKRIGKTIN